MTNALFAGLTGDEADMALYEWLNKQLQDGPLDANMYTDGKWFTNSLDACRVIEHRLNNEQFDVYHAYLAPFFDGECQKDIEVNLIMLDAPTRAAALVKVLELGKEIN